MLNTIKSKSSSAYKIILLVLFSIYFNKALVYLLIGLFLLIDDYKKMIMYVVICLIILSSNSIRTDYNKIGIVDYKKNNYYVVDKFLYKVKIKDDTLNSGDILLFNGDGQYSDSISDQKRNIRFINNDYKKIACFTPRKIIKDRIDNLNVNNSSLLNNLIYNIKDYDNDFIDIGYGLASYYFLSSIVKKNYKIGLLSIFLYSLFFVFEYKFIFLIIDCLLDKKEVDKKSKCFIKLFVVSVLNIKLFNNYSILLPLLFIIYSTINTSIEFEIFVLLIQSLLFGEINILYTLMFNSIKNVRIVLLIFGLFTILSDYFSGLTMFLANIVSLFNNSLFNIRGSITVLTFILYYFVVNRLKINAKIKSLLLILMILSPINSISYKASFIDVGQGDSFMFKRAFSHDCILIDTGSIYNYYKLKKYLFSQGIYTIDKLIISHNDSDHNGNIDNLLNDFKINKIITAGEDFKYDKYDFKYYDLGKYDNDNDNSLVYSLSINDLNFIFTGDISRAVEYKMIRDYGPLNINVLKVSHHGSYTGSSDFFIGSLMPEYAIISTSGQYNHPHFSVTRTLDKYLVKTYVTKTNKNISFCFIGPLRYLKTGSGEFVIIR